MKVIFTYIGVKIFASSIYIILNGNKCRVFFSAFSTPTVRKQILVYLSYTPSVTLFWYVLVPAKRRDPTAKFSILSIIRSHNTN